jgi:hypothetical protein
MVDHRPTDALPPGSLDGVHRFQLTVSLVELFQRADGQQVMIAPSAEDGHGRPQKIIGFERMHVFRRGVFVSEGKMSLQQRPHIVRTRIVDPDDKGAHPVRGYARRRHRGACVSPTQYFM